MKSSLFCGIAAMLLIANAHAAAPETETVPPPSESTEPTTMQLVAVPEILRLHLPHLNQREGRLVEFVPNHSPAWKAGIRRGDILLELAGQSVSSNGQLPQIDAALPAIVIRRGRLQLLSAPMLHWHPTPRLRQPGRGWVGPAARPAPARGPYAGATAQASVSTSASSFGGRAVSVSRAGDQISLEIATPDVRGPIRFRGTAEEIEQQLQQGELPPTAKREVRAALQSTN